MNAKSVYLKEISKSYGSENGEKVFAVVGCKHYN